MPLRCAICKELIAREENSFRPFCSERCKLIDLGNWAMGSYRIPGKDNQLETEDSVESNGQDRNGQKD